MQAISISNFNDLHMQGLQHKQFSENNLILHPFFSINTYVLETGNECPAPTRQGVLDITIAQNPNRRHLHMHNILLVYKYILLFKETMLEASLMQ